jgi:excisionase family DNA binding protein
MPTQRERQDKEIRYTVDQAAPMLGNGITVRFVRRLIAERRIRYVKLGRHVRIPESAIAEYIAANTVDPGPTRATSWRVA